MEFVRDPEGELEIEGSKFRAVESGIPFLSREDSIIMFRPVVEQYIRNGDIKNKYIVEVENPDIGEEN